MTPYYEDDSVTIYHGRWEDVLPGVDEVDLFFTSPPYNLGTSAITGGQGGRLAARVVADKGYGVYGDSMSQDAYNEWQAQAVATMWDKLSDTGAIFYNHRPRIQNGQAILPTDYGGDNYPIRQVIIWDRGTGLNFNDSYFLPKSEWIVVWARPLWRLVSRSAAEWGDVWRIPPERPSEHPCPFPVTLPGTRD